MNDDLFIVWVFFWSFLIVCWLIILRLSSSWFIMVFLLVLIWLIIIKLVFFFLVFFLNLERMLMFWFFGRGVLLIFSFEIELDSEFVLFDFDFLFWLVGGFFLVVLIISINVSICFLLKVNFLFELWEWCYLDWVLKMF